MKAKTENQKPQIVSDYKTMMYKIINRPKMRDEEKMKKLDELATKFRNGWPFGGQNTLAAFGAEFGYKNELEKVASTLSEQIRRMIAVREGKDLGKFDRTELDSNHVHGAKKLTTKEIKAEKDAAVVAAFKVNPIEE